jgi:hypothetical protein
MRAAAGLAATLLAVLLAGRDASAIQTLQQTVSIDLTTWAVLPVKTPLPPPPQPRPVDLRCSDHAAASFAVHGGVVEITSAGRKLLARYVPDDDWSGKVEWSYARAGVAIAAVTVHRPTGPYGSRSEIIAVDLASGSTLWQRSVPSYLPACFEAGSAVALSNASQTEWLNPRTGAPSHPPLTVVATYARRLFEVGTDRLLYSSGAEMVMLDKATLDVLWRAPAEGRDVLFTPTAVLTTSLSLASHTAALSLVVRDLANGALLRTVPAVSLRLLGETRISIALRDPSHVEVMLRTFPETDP